jgi:hypothetical protein
VVGPPLPLPATPLPPTAHTSLAPFALIPLNWKNASMLELFTIGIGTTAQAMPLKCSENVSSCPLASRRWEQIWRQPRNQTAIAWPATPHPQRQAARQSPANLACRPAGIRTRRANLAGKVAASVSIRGGPVRSISSSGRMAWPPESFEGDVMRKIVAGLMVSVDGVVEA